MPCIKDFASMQSLPSIPSMRYKCLSTALDPQAFPREPRFALAYRHAMLETQTIEIVVYLEERRMLHVNLSRQDYHEDPNVLLEQLMSVAPPESWEHILVSASADMGAHEDAVPRVDKYATPQEIESPFELDVVFTEDMLGMHADQDMAVFGYEDRVPDRRWRLTIVRNFIHEASVRVEVRVDAETPIFIFLTRPEYYENRSVLFQYLTRRVAFSEWQDLTVSAIADDVVDNAVWPFKEYTDTVSVWNRNAPGISGMPRTVGRVLRGYTPEQEAGMRVRQVLRDMLGLDHPEDIDADVPAGNWILTLTRTPVSALQGT